MTGFELIFEGSEDSSPETLRRLRGVLVAELELDVERVRAILDHPPAMLHRAERREDLEGYLKALKKAGAKALIVGGGDDVQETEKPAQSKGDVVFEFELSLDGDEEEPKAKPPPPPAPEEAVEENDPEMNGEIEDLLSEIGQNEYVIPVREKAEVHVPERLLNSGSMSVRPGAASGTEVPRAEPSIAEASAPTPEKDSAAALYSADEASVLVDDPVAEEAREATTPVVDTGAETVILSADAAPKKGRRPHISARPEFILSVGLSLFILLLVSLSRAHGPSGSEIRGIENAFQQMATSAQRAEARKPPADAGPLDRISIKVDPANAESGMSGAFFILRGKLHSAEISLTTPKPPPLTPLQIAHKDFGEPWLYKIELDQWELKEGTGGAVTGTSPARLNIEHRGFRQRAVGTGTLTAIWDEAAKKLNVELEIRSRTPAGDPATPGISYQGMSAYRVFLTTKASFAASKTAPPAP